MLGSINTPSYWNCVIKQFVGIPEMYYFNMFPNYKTLFLKIANEIANLILKYKF